MENERKTMEDLLSEKLRYQEKENISEEPFKKMSHFENALLLERYSGKTNLELAGEMEISRQRVSQLLERAEENFMRRYMTLCKEWPEQTYDDGTKLSRPTYGIKYSTKTRKYVREEHGCIMEQMLAMALVNGYFDGNALEKPLKELREEGMRK